MLVFQIFIRTFEAMIINEKVFFTSCNKEPFAEIILDSNELKTEMKDLTIGMYNSRNTDGIKPSSVGSFNLTPAEKTLLANTALNLLKSYGLTEAEWKH